MQVFTDAARDDNVAGMGWILVTTDGMEIENNRYMRGNYTSMEAEYFALLDGLRHAKRYDDDSVSVICDCKPLIQKMREPDAYDQDWYDRRQGCHRLLNKFDSWEMEWTDRSNNHDADRLAYEALEAGRRSRKI
jgi:ribonuclease HI